MWSSILDKFVYNDDFYLFIFQSKVNAQRIYLHSIIFMYSINIKTIMLQKHFFLIQTSFAC